MSWFSEKLLDPMKLPKKPEVFFKEKAKKYGELFPIYLPQTPTTYFSGTQEAAKEIFNAPISTFHPNTKNNPIAPIVGSNSLILQGGEEHKKDKRLMLPFFHGASLLQNKSIILDIVNEELNLFKGGKLLNSMQELTLHIIIATAFGVKERTERLKLRAIILDYVNSYSQLLMFIPQSRHGLLGIGPWDRFRKKRKNFDEKILELLNNNKDETSLLAKFNNLQSEGILSSIIDQIKTILIAGHETTAITLFWCLYYIGQNEKVYQRLLEMTADLSYDELLDDPYLHAVCDESMRMHPSVPIILRSLVEDYQYRGRAMKKGENIGLALTLLHHDPKIYENPSEFNPQRFIDNQYESFQFAPFGGSNRKCIGSSFAYLEMKLFLITLFKRGGFSIKVDNPVKAVIRGVTMCPASDIPFKI